MWSLSIWVNDKIRIKIFIERNKFLRKLEILGNSRNSIRFITSFGYDNFWAAILKFLEMEFDAKGESTYYIAPRVSKQPVRRSAQCDKLTAPLTY